MRPRILLVLGGLGVAAVVGFALVLSGSPSAEAASVTKVAAGGDHSCAIIDGGGVQCWGDNDNGQLGNNDLGTDSSVPVDVCDFFLLFCSNIDDIIDISAGLNHTCAATSGGNVLCWGDNSLGQLGNDTMTDSDDPVTVCAETFLFGPPACDDDLEDVVEVAVGDNHSCARLSGGTVKCWGDNDNGQVGDGTNAVRDLPETVCIVAGLFACSTAVTDAIDIAAGGDHTCAVLSGGGVQCWGDNDNGQLGNDDLGNNTDVAVDVCSTSIFVEPPPCAATLSGAETIGAGWNHTCAVMDDGGVKCWGDNVAGQLGNGFTADRDRPVDVCTDEGIFFCDVDLDDIDEILDVGDLHSCVLNDATGVTCWGDNAAGQLGNDDVPDDSLLPVEACIFIIFLLDCSPVTGFTSVSAGNDHTCGATAAGGVKCWGENSPNGQVGDGTTANRDVPTDVTTLGPKPTPTPTATATATATDTATPTAAATSTSTPTVAGPTATATATSPGPTATATPTSPGGVIVGDANCDGFVNAIDALFVLQFIAALLGGLPCPVEADANLSGDLNAIDSALILQFVASLIAMLPP